MFPESQWHTPPHTCHNQGKCLQPTTDASLRCVTSLCLTAPSLETPTAWEHPWATFQSVSPLIYDYTNED